MRREELAAALAETDAMGRDVAERVITGLASREKSDDDEYSRPDPLFEDDDAEEKFYDEGAHRFFFPTEQTNHYAWAVAAALNVAVEAVEQRLRWLAERGLICWTAEAWQWTAGPVSDFFAVRIAENWS
jgi:hypothetical protein